MDDRKALPESLKRVVLIYSANWSGSTMVGAVLGATKGGPLKQLHVGELHAFNNPKKKGNTYGNPRGSENFTDFWNDVTPQKTKVGLFSLVARKSRCESYIDSSKIPAWLNPIALYAHENEVSVKIVVGYRNFASIGASALKRGHDIAMGALTCTRYLRLPEILATLGRTQVDAIVDTDSFVREPASCARKLCDLVDIPYFEGKEEYWRYPTAQLYGSRTQLDHFRDPATGAYTSKPRRGRDQLSREQLAAFEAHGLLEFEDRLISGELGPIVRSDTHDGENQTPEG